MTKTKPIRLNYNDNEYILEYSRETVAQAEGNGFLFAQVDEFPLTGVSNLFYYSFLKNHPDMTKEETDRILTELGGLNGDEIMRLGQLYQAPLETVLNLEDKPRKNSKVSITL